MKYVVDKEFLDRFDNNRHCKVGEPHAPHNVERAKSLIELGFISAVSEKEEKKTLKGNKTDVKPEGEDDGEKITGE